MKTGAASCCKEYEGGRAHANLRHILNVQARDSAFHRSRRAAAARLRNSPLEKCIQLRSGNATIARFVCAHGERKYSLYTLPDQSGDSYYGCPIQKLHALAQTSLERRNRSRLLVLNCIPLVHSDDD